MTIFSPLVFELQNAVLLYALVVEWLQEAERRSREKKFLEADNENYHTSLLIGFVYESSPLICLGSCHQTSDFLHTGPSIISTCAADLLNFCYDELLM